MGGSGGARDALRNGGVFFGRSGEPFRTAAGWLKAGDPPNERMLFGMRGFPKGKSKLLADGFRYSTSKWMISVKSCALKFRARSRTVISARPQVPGADPAGRITVQT